MTLAEAMVFVLSGHTSLIEDKFGNTIAWNNDSRAYQINTKQKQILFPYLVPAVDYFLKLQENEVGTLKRDEELHPLPTQTRVQPSGYRRRRF